MREEQVVAWGRLKVWQVRKVLLVHERQLNKVAATVAQPAKLALPTGTVEEGRDLEDELKQEHAQAKKDKEEKDPSAVGVK